MESVSSALALFKNWLLRRFTIFFLDMNSTISLPPLHEIPRVFPVIIINIDLMRQRMYMLNVCPKYACILRKIYCTDKYISIQVRESKT